MTQTTVGIISLFLRTFFKVLGSENEKEERGVMPEGVLAGS